MNRRIETLKAIMFQYDENAFFYERMQLLEQARTLFAKENPAYRFAKTFSYLLENISIDIRPGEWIVGFMPQVQPTPEQEEALLRNSIDNNFRMSDYVTFDASGLIEITDPDERYNPSWFCSYGHYVPDYERVLKLGFSGIADEARRRLEDVTLSQPQKDFLLCAIITSEAMCRLGERYHDLAVALAQSVETCKEKERFELIAECCRTTPSQPAQTLLQAMQTVWFVHLVVSGVIGGRDFSFGRMDEYLLPYYLADEANGLMNEDYATELFEELYIHVMELSGFSVATYATKRIVNNGSIQYVVIGGTNRQGDAICNPLTFAALRANELLKTKQPALILRWFPGINKKLMDYAVKMCSSGDGYPAFFDERKVVEALMTHGSVPREEALEFAFYGCDNIALPGNCDELREVWHNFPKYLELALNEGRDMATSRLIGAKTRPRSEMAGIDDILHALFLQARYFLNRARRKIIEFDYIWPLMRPFSFESTISKNAIQRAESINLGGSDYKHYTNHLCGLATTADSLYAIKKLVFEEGRLSLDDLWNVLGNSWQGHEILQAEVKNKFPSFGNDIDEVDQIAVNIANWFVQENLAIPALPSGRRPYPSIYSMSHHRNLGKVVGATADGRNAYQPISESQSGTYGREKKGPIGTLGSAAKLPLHHTPSGGNNIKLNPRSIKAAEGQNRLRSLIETYFEQGGNQIQINIVDNDVLQDAMIHPEKHKNLLVRIVGYSAHFVMLSPEQQLEIIQRNSL